MLTNLFYLGIIIVCAAWVVVFLAWSVFAVWMFYQMIKEGW